MSSKATLTLFFLSAFIFATTKNCCAQVVNLIYATPAHTFVVFVEINGEKKVAALNFENGDSFASPELMKSTSGSAEITLNGQEERELTRKIKLSEMSILSGGSIELVLGRGFFEGQKLKVDFIRQELIIGGVLSQKGKSYKFDPESGEIDTPTKKILPLLSAMIESTNESCPSGCFDPISGEAKPKPQPGDPVFGIENGRLGMYIIRSNKPTDNLLNAMDFCGRFEIDFKENRIWFEESEILRARYILSFMTPLIFDVKNDRIILAGARPEKQDQMVDEFKVRGAVVTKIGDEPLNRDSVSDPKKFEKAFRSLVEKKYFWVDVDGKELRLNL